MFSHLPTSRKIASYFAVYAFVLVAIFGLIVNILHFSKWRHDTNTLLNQLRIWIVTSPQSGSWNHKMWSKWWNIIWWFKVTWPQVVNNPNKWRSWPRQRLIREMVQVVDLTDEIKNTLDNVVLLPQTARIDNEYILYRIDNRKLYYVEITALINSQKDLLWITAIAMLSIGLLTYLISKKMVNQSLSHIKTLLDYVKHLSLHTVDQKVPLMGPPEDEIRQIAEALQSSLDTISRQSDSLKDFVSHASHELKTPLMSLTTSLDLALKTKDGSYIQDAKDVIWQIKSLLDTLLLITRREYHQLKQDKIDIVDTVHHIVKQHQESLVHKNLSVHIQWPQVYNIFSHTDICNMIISNLLANAIKYSPTDQVINIVIDEGQNHLSISNAGETIAIAHQDHIYDRFYKIGNQTGFWLGLYLVKLLVDRQGRTISYSDHDHINHFVVKFGRS